MIIVNKPVFIFNTPVFSTLVLNGPVNYLLYAVDLTLPFTVYGLSSCIFLFTNTIFKGDSDIMRPMKIKLVER